MDSAKDPLLNRGLYCSSILKIKCVVPTGFSDARKDLHTGFK